MKVQTKLFYSFTVLNGILICITILAYLMMQRAEMSMHTALEKNTPQLVFFQKYLNQLALHQLKLREVQEVLEVDSLNKVDQELQILLKDLDLLLSESVANASNEISLDLKNYFNSA